MVNKLGFVFCIFIALAASTLLVSAIFGNTLVSPGNNAFVNATIPMINATTGYPANCTYYVSNATNGSIRYGALPVDNSNYHSLASLSISSLTDGNYTVVASCINFSNAGDIVNSSANITKDTVNPQIVINSASGRMLASTSVWHNFTVTDTNLNYCYWYRDDAQFTLSRYSEINSSVDFANSYTMSQGYHNWSVVCVDYAGNSNGSATQNFTVDDVAPVVTAISPAEYTNSTSIVFNVSSVDSSTTATNCWMTLTNGVNNISMTKAGDYFNATNASISEGNYLAKYYCNDSLGNLNSGVTGNFTIDRTVPTFSSEPSENPSTTSVVITYRASESVRVEIKYGPSSSDLHHTKTVSTYSNGTDISITTGLDADTPYYYNITICDHAYNCATDGPNHFDTDAESSSSSGGGSSGGGGDGSFWTSTFSPNANQTTMGYNKILKSGQRIKVVIGKVNHYVGIVKLASTRATINVSSDNPQQVDMHAGDTEKFEVTNDSYYDIKITLEKVNSTSANLTVWYINEQMTAASSNATRAAVDEENESIRTMSGEVGEEAAEAGAAATGLLKNKWFWISTVGVLLIAGVLVYYFFFMRKPGVNRKVKIRDR